MFVTFAEDDTKLNWPSQSRGQKLKLVCGDAANGNLGVNTIEEFT